MRFSQSSQYILMLDINKYFNEENYIFVLWNITKDLFLIVFFRCRPPTEFVTGNWCAFVYHKQIFVNSDAAKWVFLDQFYTARIEIVISTKKFCVLVDVKSKLLMYISISFTHVLTNLRRTCYLGWSGRFY